MAISEYSWNLSKFIWGEFGVYLGCVLWSLVAAELMSGPPSPWTVGAIRAAQAQLEVSELLGWWACCPMESLQRGTCKYDVCHYLQRTRSWFWEALAPDKYLYTCDSSVTLSRINTNQFDQWPEEPMRQFFQQESFKNEDFKILPVQSFCFHLWLRLAFQALESRQDRAALAKNGRHHREEEEQFDQYAFVETLQQKRRTIPGGKDREEDQN